MTINRNHLRPNKIFNIITVLSLVLVLTGCASKVSHNRVSSSKTQTSRNKATPKTVKKNIEKTSSTDESSSSNSTDQQKPAVIPLTMSDIFGDGTNDMQMRALIYYGLNNPHISAQWQALKSPSTNSNQALQVTGIPNMHPTWTIGNSGSSDNTSGPIPTVRTVLPGMDATASSDVQARDTSITYSINEFDSTYNVTNQENDYAVHFQDVINFINANGGKNVLNSVNYQLAEAPTATNSDSDNNSYSSDNGSSDNDSYTNNDDDSSDNDTDDSDVSSDDSDTNNDDSSNSDDQDNNQDIVNSNDNIDDTDN